MAFWDVLVLSQLSTDLQAGFSRVIPPLSPGRPIVCFMSGTGAVMGWPIFGATGVHGGCGMLG